MTGSACRNIRQSLGVYVVGAIDPAERARVDSHLSTCPDCREELAGLAGLPALLGRVPAADAERLILHSAEVKDLEEPPDELLGSLLRRVAERRAVRRWRSLGAAAAAVVIALAGGAAGARILNPGSHVPGPVQPASRVEVVSATNPRTNVSAIISYTAKSWGTGGELPRFGLAARLAAAQLRDHFGRPCAGYSARYLIPGMLGQTAVLYTA